MNAPKITTKLYHCRNCGHESKQSTNHYGATYSWGNYNRCQNCGWKNPLDVTVWDCVEEKPEGAWVPEEWKQL